MRIHTVLAALLVLAAAVMAQAQTVNVEFLMGRVNLTAQNASLRAIINEWSRVGGTRVINPERLGGAPVTLQLTGVPERLALDILLRDVAGYIVGPRQTLMPGMSAYDSLVVVTAATGPEARLAPAGPAGGPGRGQSFQRPPVQNLPRRRPAIANPEPDNDSDTVSEPEPDERATPQGSVPNTQSIRPALVPPPTQQETPASGGPTPANPFGAQGASRPGIITSVPQTTPPPGQPEP